MTVNISSKYNLLILHVHFGNAFFKISKYGTWNVRQSYINKY
jgi:hypothetical protein